MKEWFLTFLVLTTAIIVKSQSRPINDNDYRTWNFVSDGKISNDGNFVFYNIKTGAFPFRVLKSIVQSTSKDWKMETRIINDGNLEFSEDSKVAIFIDTNNRLNINFLRKGITTYLSNVSSFVLNRKVSKWLLFKKSDGNSTTVLQNLKTGTKSVYDNISEAYFDRTGSLLILKSVSNTNEVLKVVDLASGKESNIWDGNPIGPVVFDNGTKHMAFLSNNSIWYYNFKDPKPYCLITIDSLSSFKNMLLNQLSGFSKDGNRLFLTLREKETVKAIRRERFLEIWSYTDRRLRSEREVAGQYRTYAAVLDLSSKKLIQLEKENEHLQFSDLTDYPTDTLAIVSYYGSPNPESNWNPDSGHIQSLINTKTGNRIPLNWSTNIGLNLSPCGRFLVYFDIKQQNFFSYEVKTSKIKNLTSLISTKWDSNEGYFPIIEGPRGIAGWLKNDDAILVYDQNDIWKLYLDSKFPPVNLTNGYGRNRNVVFTVEQQNFQNRSFNRNERIILSAFNTENKHNGFFSKVIDKTGDPTLLSMGAFIYKTNSRYVSSYDFSPVKANDADIYLVKRMTSTESPNYFISKNFKTFTVVSDIHPEKEVNWLTTELHTWKSLDGTKLQGILFKPNGFDPKKKYPLIINIYERLSNGLNAFLKPDFSSGNIDIPTFVSNGYLVFCPDIYYKIGTPMQGSYDAVISAARYVSDLPFVNSQKLGLQGHSFGAVQTNYIVTQTNLFAAASSASGISNWISGYGTLSGSGYNLASIYETGQTRMGSSLWENLDGYIKYSPIISADRINTPLLMAHGKTDGVCPYQNVMEFFLGLRRLGKKVWMLSYQEAGHAFLGKEAEDFTLRTKQFFDYYLLDKPVPYWMLDEMNTADKESKRGLKLDTSGIKPGPGLIPDRKENNLYRKPITIRLK